MLKWVPENNYAVRLEAFSIAACPIKPLLFYWGEPSNRKIILLLCVLRAFAVQHSSVFTDFRLPTTDV